MNLVTSREEAARIAMWSMMATECVLFGSLLAMRGGPRLVPPSFAIASAAAIAIALVVACTALSTAIRRLRGGQSRAALRLVGAALVLGILALGFEIASARLFGARDAVGMVVIGLHAAHVAAALSLGMWTLALIRSGHISRHHHEVLSLVRSFWYFVAAVWIFVWPLFTAPRP
jgi:heme/copper-type cytochrome/quinol oxidase subunit 3